MGGIEVLERWVPRWTWRVSVTQSRMLFHLEHGNGMPQLFGLFVE